MPNRKLTCVIIDDDGVLRSLITSILRRSAVEVVGEATHTGSALNLCRTHQPRLVLLDIALRDKSGLELLPEILAVSPESRVMMVSSESSIGEVRTALNEGAAGFIVTPFTSQRLLDAVGRSLGMLK